MYYQLSARYTHPERPVSYRPLVSLRTDGQSVMAYDHLNEREHWYDRTTIARVLRVWRRAGRDYRLLRSHAAI